MATKLRLGHGNLHCQEEGVRGVDDSRGGRAASKNGHLGVQRACTWLRLEREAGQTCRGYGQGPGLCSPQRRLLPKRCQVIGDPATARQRDIENRLSKLQKAVEELKADIAQLEARLKVLEDRPYERV